MDEPPNLPPAPRNPFLGIPTSTGTVDEQLKEYQRIKNATEEGILHTEYEIEVGIHRLRKENPKLKLSSKEDIKNTLLKDRVGKLKILERMRNEIQEKIDHLKELAKKYDPKLTGSGRKRKLKGKGINNPWIEFIKNNRGKFSSLKELSVLYHSKRK
jgi:hypothetical protein